MECDNRVCVTHLYCLMGYRNAKDIFTPMNYEVSRSSTAVLADED